MHTSEPLVLKSISLDIGIATETLQRYKSPGTDQISAELMMN
jgi:hypothetical protein